MVDVYVICDISCANIEGLCAFNLWNKNNFEEHSYFNSTGDQESSVAWRSVFLKSDILL